MKFTQETKNFLNTSMSHLDYRFSKYFDDGFWVCPDAEIHYNDVLEQGVLSGLEFYHPKQTDYLIAKRQLISVRFSPPWFEDETVELSEAWIKNPLKKNHYDMGVDIGFRNAIVPVNNTLFIGPIHENSVIIMRPIRKEYQPVLKRLLNRRLLLSQT